MNRLKFIIDVVDRVIAVARLIKDAAELGSDSTDSLESVKSGNDKSEDSEES